EEILKPAKPFFWSDWTSTRAISGWAGLPAPGFRRLVTGALPRLHGQEDVDRRPFAEAALDRERAAVGFGDPFRNREAEAAATGGGGSGGAHAVEAFEDVGKMLRRDALAGIAHGDEDLTRNPFCSDGHPPAGRCVAHRILQQVREQAHQLLLV